MADCQDLHYGDASFDVVSSSVGVIFAPDHERVAAELARVCRPGGRLGLTAWRRDSGIGQMFAAMAPFMPTPPAGAGSRSSGATRTTVARCSATRSSCRSRSSTRATRATTRREMWELYRVNYGPSFTLWTSLDEERRAELDAAMEAYFETYRDGDRIDVERRYIIVTGIRKAG